MKIRNSAILVCVGVFLCLPGLAQQAEKPAYRNPQLPAVVDQPTISADGKVSVSVEVSNRGKMAGDEVVQLYLTYSVVPGAPLRALQGFQRVYLQPAQSKKVTFTLTNRQLSVVDESGNRSTVSGKVQVWVGGGPPVRRSGLQRMAGVATEFTITGESMLPD